MSNFVPPIPKAEPTPRAVWTVVGDRTIAASTRAMLLIAYGAPIRPGSEVPLLPTYFFPIDDVDRSVLVLAGDDGERRWWDLQVDDRRIDYAAWAFREPDGRIAGLIDHLTFCFDAMDAWYEEAEQIFVHARDPHKRVDVLASTRHVEVSLDGIPLADSHRPFLLFETLLPTRYYLPREDVHLARLEDSASTTSCPYKGVARYWSVAGAGEAGRDVAWTYPDPIPEQPKLTDLVAFYNEKVDIDVDGERQSRPSTPWS